eukprot:SAG31_NODE_4744_length_2986_cov_1.698995_4_plen_113_part_01
MDKRSSELAARVPLIIKSPAHPASQGKHTKLFAELVDVYPTLAALTGTANTYLPEDVATLDGVSLVPAFEDPTVLTIPAAAANGVDYTFNKTIAYSQYPGQSFGGCDGGYVLA